MSFSEPTYKDLLSVQIIDDENINQSHRNSEGFFLYVDNYSTISGTKVYYDGSTDELSFGSWNSWQILKAINDSKLPENMDYQNHFNILKSNPSKRAKDAVDTFDGALYEVKIEYKKKIIQFRLPNPDHFFYNYREDPIVKEVSKILDAIALQVGKRYTSRFNKD